MITIYADTPKEIADLVLALQNRRIENEVSEETVRNGLCEALENACEHKNIEIKEI